MKKLSDFYRSRKQNREDKDDGWKLIGGADRYETYFHQILEGRKLRDFVRGRYSEGKKTYVLDFMGYGLVVKDILRDRNEGAGLAVALSDPRGVIVKCRDKMKQVLTLIDGDVLVGSTWRRMNLWLQSQTFEDKKFHLILCRAAGGLSRIPEDYVIHFLLLQKLWNLLSSDSGALITDVYYSTKKINEPKIVYDWVQKLKKERIGCVVPNQDKFWDPLNPISILKLIKEPDSPSLLPIVSA